VLITVSDLVRATQWHGLIVPSHLLLERKNMYLRRRRIRNRFCATISLVRNRSILFWRPMLYFGLTVHLTPVAPTPTQHVKKRLKLSPLLCTYELEILEGWLKKCLFVLYQLTFLIFPPDATIIIISGQTFSWKSVDQKRLRKCTDLEFC